MVEILTDMTARDLCQLLVYRSHCVDDNSWTLVEHHPHLGLGRATLSAVCGHGSPWPSSPPTPPGIPQGAGSLGILGRAGSSSKPWLGRVLETHRD